MSAMRKALLGTALAAAVVLGAGESARAVGGGEAAAGEATGFETAGFEAAGSEADLAHHGHVSLWEGRLGVWLVSENHGPADVSRATVRLAFSEPLAGGQELPPSCLWGSDRVVVCRTAELRAAGAIGELALDLRTAGSPDEMTVDISTVWTDGTTDGNPGNDRHRVLVLATGDPYVF
ncbi:hypothetical protein ACFYV5_28700 [Streptomyces sp. NPDC003035]|uniref:hypothetical protein n=1 Tax=Streptomyces sp. NPDC003035 TaxID=3364676 RepID=UPI0036CC0A12